MLASSRFARASYALFAVAVLLASLKLGGVLDAGPPFLRTVPATTVARATEPANVEREVSGGEALYLPDAGGPETAGRLLAGGADPSNKEDDARIERSSQSDLPVFYRPSRGSSGASSGEPVCGNLGDFPKSGRAVFPLPEGYFDSYDDTWGAPRPQGGHEGSDLMSPTGTPEVAITDGTLVPVAGSNGNGWNTLGGYTVMLEAAYDVGPIKKGDLFYYAYLDRESTLPTGTKVRAGERIGVAGDTGEGPEDTRGKFPPHLHFGWYDPSGDRSNLGSGAMNPYPLLLWLEENGGAVIGGTDASYCEAPRAAVPEPSTGDDGWPAPNSPGVTPDLDTGDENDPRPSPTIQESRDRGDRSSERGRGRESGQNEPNEREPGEKNDEQAGATGEEPEANPASGSEKDEETEDKRGEPSAAVEDHHASGSSAGDEPSLPDRASQPVHASTLAGTIQNKTEEAPGGRDAEAPDEEEAREEKTREPPERKESERDRSADPDEPAESRNRSLPAVRRPARIDDRSWCAASREDDLRVTRTQGPHDGRRTPIEYDEWREVVEEDPELRMYEAVEISTDAGQTRRYENKGLATWTGHPDRDKVWFDLCGGDIVVKNPDEPTIEKMKSIADALDARVRRVDDRER